ncbi:hypothetical protein N7474_008957 [Penicillium riverlandense]|uniref:uncharacterized protein n=1 Tax=Penicillium riverlandense TaxID=1903569 RepID=UPI002547F5B9|nr:uncharacterized protein N7474_008957 [Penicillium riverlandense]KAJ5812656.1 hypothetical protein N7474_008957 [Penicillium riverlandense]
MEKREDHGGRDSDNELNHAEVLGDGRVNLGMRHVWRVSQELPLLKDQGMKETGTVNVTPPHMNIVIQVVGSRGDIQPFIAIGVALKRAGHRVRIATHETFSSFVQDVGLEFFNIGGDPRKLMAYMVKNPGLLPSMKTLRQGSIREKRDDMREILEGCWKSCFLPGDGPGNQEATPFLANAIIANPPSFAHAQDPRFATDWQIVRAEFDIPFGDPIYILLVCIPPPSNIITDNLRSPALIPKPEDWGARISVSGFYFLPLASEYTPSESLQAFLDAGSPPIYIGFGSIVIDDPKSLTLLLLEAVRLAGVRAVISTGWSGLARFLRGASRGAGTTAAAIAAGKPSVVVPFFGDQPFWGSMIARAGAGPEPIPFKKLTAASLSVAIKDALNCSVRKTSHSLGDLVNDEDGVQAGIRSFYQQLDLSMLQCSLTPMSAATWRVRKTEVRLGSTSSALLMDMGLLDLDKLELYNIHVGPRDPVSGIALAMLDSAGSAIKGFEEIRSSMSRKFKRKSSAPGYFNQFRDSRTGACLKGMSRASSSLVRAPIHVGVAFTQGLHNAPKIWGDRTVRPLETFSDFPSGVKAGGKEMCFGSYDGVTSLGTHLVSGRHNVLKGLSGLGFDILSFLSKATSGLSAIITYPLGGLDTEVAQYFSRRYVSSMDVQLVEQGRSEYAKLSDEDRAGIVHQFQEVTSAAFAVGSPTVYLIRHGEKPSNGSTGLSAQGLQRAQCLRSVFGASSDYDIGYIMAETPKKDGKRDRPYETVEPLAQDLGITVDTSCDRDDSKCVKDVVKDYNGEGNLLICWEHDALTDIVQELGDDNAPSYPDGRYDIIWTDPSPYSNIAAKTGENCPGLS